MATAATLSPIRPPQADPVQQIDLSPEERRRLVETTAVIKHVLESFKEKPKDPPPSPYFVERAFAWVSTNTMQKLNLIINALFLGCVYQLPGVATASKVFIGTLADYGLSGWNEFSQSINEIAVPPTIQALLAISGYALAKSMANDALYYTDKSDKTKNKEGSSSTPIIRNLALMGYVITKFSSDSKAQAMAGTVLTETVLQTAKFCALADYVQACYRDRSMIPNGIKQAAQELVQSGTHAASRLKNAVTAYTPDSVKRAAKYLHENPGRSVLGALGTICAVKWLGVVSAETALKASLGSLAAATAADLTNKPARAPEEPAERRV